MPFKPPKKAPVSIQDEGDSDERPTVIPEFDPEAFARESEAKQRAVPDGMATMEEARRLYADGGYEQALFLVTQLLSAVPLHNEARILERDCRAALEQECLSDLGPMNSTFVLGITPEELKGFALDNVSGFLISLLDGRTDVETLLDVCGLPRLLALRHLRDLFRRGIIARNQ